MSDTGLAAVTAAPIPNENQQQSHQDKVSIITDNMSIAHKVAITKPTTLPLSPALAQSTNQSNHESVSQNITAPKEPVTPIKSTPISISDSQSPHTVISDESLEKFDVDNELKSDPSLQSGDKIGAVSVVSGQESRIINTDAEGQANAIRNDNELPARESTKYEETIIDGFAICAFNSWEDLQDELNERIAADLARERAAEKERQDSEKVIKKRKHKSKPKIPHATDESNSRSQSSNKEEKSKKSKKTGDGAKSKKGTNGHPSTSGHIEEQGKKNKSSNKTEVTASLRDESRTDRLIDGETSQTNKKIKREDEMRHDGNSIDNQSDNSNRSNPNRQSDQNTSQSPQVHNRSETQSRTNTSVLASDLLKDPSHPIPCSPYRNSHLNRMYDVTSSIPQPMQTSLPQTGAQMNQTKTQQQQSQQHSQSQSHIRHGSPAQQFPSNYPPKPSLIPGLPQYPGNAQAPIYPPPGYNFPTASQSQSFYHHSLHNMPPPPPPPNHYLYHPPGASVHPTNSHSQIPSHLNIRSQSNHSQNLQAQQHYHHQHQQQPSTPHLQPPPPPTFGMYSPHIGHPQQTQESSMVASMSMSSLPTPYGSPYIVTDTTISRQTSIIPPPTPTALEQAAASSAANRFGHHPNMLHSMSAYNPANAAAAAAAAASVAAQSHHQNHQTSLYQSPFPSERSFMDLARSYAESGGHLANYHSMMQSSYPAPTSSVTANPYSLDRWPKVAFEQHQRAVSRYNSFYPNGMPMLPDRTGFGSSNLRPPPFPAGLFPPPF